MAQLPRAVGLSTLHGGGNESKLATGLDRGALLALARLVGELTLVVEGAMTLATEVEATGLGLLVVEARLDDELVTVRLAEFVNGLFELVDVRVYNERRCAEVVGVRVFFMVVLIVDERRVKAFLLRRRRLRWLLGSLQESRDHLSQRSLCRRWSELSARQRRIDDILSAQGSYLVDWW